MTASDAESWAKLRLVEGDSSATKWELVSSLGHTTLTVGSNSDCTWVVRAEGVRPIHFSLHWDGGTLRAADVYSAGDVRIDGQALTSQWKPLLGRARIEFGRAAMVVEASATASPAPPKSGDHPLEPKPAPHGSSNPPPERKQRSAKETLIGVAPHMIQGLVLPPSDSSTPPPPGQSSPAGPSSSRPPVSPSYTPPANRGSDRSMKATLVGGVGISPVPTPLAQPAASFKGNSTLVGFTPTAETMGLLEQFAPRPSSAADDAASSSPSSSAPSGRRMTQKGMVSQPPGVVPDAVSLVPARAVSEPSGRINGAWQEKVDDGRSGRTLRGHSPIEDDPEAIPRAPRMPRNESRWGNLDDRLSDIPTQMRDPADFESRRARQGFPWRYLGVLVLTGVAYFAWLYLLDHM